jgi:hypothetical protein
MTGEKTLRRASKAQADRGLFRTFGFPDYGRYLGSRKLGPVTRHRVERI